MCNTLRLLNWLWAVSALDCCCCLLRRVRRFNRSFVSLRFVSLEWQASASGVGTQRECPRHAPVAPAVAAVIAVLLRCGGSFIGLYFRLFCCEMIAPLLPIIDEFACSGLSVRAEGLPPLPGAWLVIFYGDRSDLTASWTRDGTCCDCSACDSFPHCTL